MFANFQLSGSTPQRRDLLKREQSEGAIWGDVSINKRAGIPSGLCALLLFKLENTDMTSSSVSVMSSKTMSGSIKECSSGLWSLWLLCMRKDRSEIFVKSIRNVYVVVRIRSLIVVLLRFNRDFQWNIGYLALYLKKRPETFRVKITRCTNQIGVVKRLSRNILLIVLRSSRNLCLRYSLG